MIGAATRAADGLADDDFALVARLARETCGLALTDRHRSMVAARLPRLARQAGHKSVKELLASVARQDKQSLMRFADVITTHHTYFARDPGTFEVYQNTLLPGIIRRIEEKRGEPDLRIWCAAASTGEEPWTLALIGREVLAERYARWRAGLLATDISRGSLAQASRGEYPESDVARLPEVWRARYFERTGTRGGGPSTRLRVRAELRQDVAFRPLNLTEPFRFRQPFHAVFCRNVLIYFDTPTRRSVVDRLISTVMVGGYLIVGSSESLEGFPRVKRIHPAIYERVS